MLLKRCAKLNGLEPMISKALFNLFIINQNIPVLMISADEQLPQLAEASCAGGYLEKPFDISALNGAVKKIIMFAA